MNTGYGHFIVSRKAQTPHMHMNMENPQKHGAKKKNVNAVYLHRQAMMSVPGEN